MEREQIIEAIAERLYGQGTYAKPWADASDAAHKRYRERATAALDVVTPYAGYLDPRNEVSAHTAYQKGHYDGYSAASEEGYYADRALVAPEVLREFAREHEMLALYAEDAEGVVRHLTIAVSTHEWSQDHYPNQQETMS